MAKLHPTIRAAGAERVLPAWAEMTPERRAHAERVGRLVWRWGKALGLEKKERRRWRAAGLLHDALKDVSPDELRKIVADAESWPDPLLHGPACAERLRAEGVDDEPLLRAISHHTTGHPDFGQIGQAVYMADYLEPGRRRLARRRAAWRRRMPGDWQAVLVEVAASKIGTLLDRRFAIPQVMSDFWRGLLE